jgi:cytochrome c-type biogenesis protein CcmH
MLTAAEAVAAERQDAPWRAPKGLAVAAAALLPAVALGLYFLIGQPGLPGQPRLAETLPATAEAPDEGEAAEVARLVAELSQRMTERPQDPVGWRLLGRAQGSLGRWAEAAGSYARAVAAGGGDAETLSAWGEALIFAAEGQITPPVEEVLRRALAADPKEPRARYYQGLARLQAGDAAGALALWRGLAAEAPPDAAWASFIAERIRLAETMLPGPTGEDLAAAAALSPEEREAMAEGMVERLADRLERQPEDLEGWLRLARAYGVLGRADEQRRALDRAADLAPGRPDIQLALADAEAAAGAPESAASRLEALIGRLPGDAPERVEAAARLKRLRDTK